ncbi:MAG: hypothetical protein IJN44_12130 [Clostridia bacterium]|nr:hypothetical protein [Clostridia bacterium]
MQKQERRQYLRLIYKQAFSSLGITLVIALVAGTVLGGGIYMVHALCAVGFVMLCWAWFNYLKITGLQPFGRYKKEKKPVPYFHRRFKEEKPHRPSFRMDSADFDDDLTSSTVAEAENFTKKQADTALAIARAICGVILIVASFLIPMQ